MSSTHVQREMAAAQSAQLRQAQAKATEAQRIEFHCTLPTGPKRKKPLVCDYIPLEFSQEYIDHLKKPNEFVITGDDGITLQVTVRKRIRQIHYLFHSLFVSFLSRYKIVLLTSVNKRSILFKSQLNSRFDLKIQMVLHEKILHKLLSKFIR